MKLCAWLAVALLTTAGCSSGSESSSGSSGSGTGTTIPADGGDTWASFADGFFTKYCAECHSGSNLQAGLDLTQHAVVTANKDVIRCGVCVTQDPSWNCNPTFPPAKQFPATDSTGKNPKPTDAERNYVVGWIDAGCP
jgi:hypothetical protein